MSWNINELRNPALRAFFTKVFGSADTMSSDITTGTTLSKVKIAPAASVATTGVNYQKIVTIGDETGTTPYGFGDVTKPTTGLMASFGRTTIATSTQTDTGLDVRVINKVINTAANVLMGAYIKAKNYAGATVGKLVGLKVEVVTDGTVTNGGTAIQIASDGSTLNCEIELSTGAKIFSGAAVNVAGVYGEVGAKDATGSIYISTAGYFFVQVANAAATTDWKVATVS